MLGRKVVTQADGQRQHPLVVRSFVPNPLVMRPGPSRTRPARAPYNPE